MGKLLPPHSQSHNQIQGGAHHQEMMGHKWPLMVRVTRVARVIASTTRRSEVRQDGPVRVMRAVGAMGSLPK